jgi:hypothetical protein
VARGSQSTVPQRQTAVVLTAAAVAVLYVVHPPAAPDLAAQVARVDAVRSGAFLWWNGWFGGLQLPAYSALAPLVMAKFGVGLAAALAALACTGFGTSLLRHAPRPQAGAIGLGVAAFADVYAGRVTFALGAAAAVGCMALIRRRSAVLATPAALLTFLFSPLAGLFLGLVALGAAIASPQWRRAGAAVASILVAAAVVETLMFPGQGQMPYPWWHMAIAVVTIGVVAAVCPDRTVRAVCAVVAAATLLFFFVPSPVGTNMMRLCWLGAAPTVAAMGRLRRLPSIVLVAALAIWPAIDLGIQLHRADSPASQAAFYSPLVSAWRQQTGGESPRASGERIEVINPTSQWAAAYVAPLVPIARGWDRPTDRADNSLFYDGTLTAESYHRWLLDSSVGWVALPLQVPLDYASVAEATIVRTHPGYLEPVWSTKQWALYRVIGARSIVRGAKLLRVTSTSLTFSSAAAGNVEVNERWSRYLRLVTPQGVVRTCIAARGAGTLVEVPGPGTYGLEAHFDADLGGGRKTCSPHAAGTTGTTS